MFKVSKSLGTNNESTLKGVKTPQSLFYYLNRALKDGASDRLYLTNILILTPTFMSGNKKTKKYGIYPNKTFSECFQ